MCLCTITSGEEVTAEGEAWKIIVPCAPYLPKHFSLPFFGGWFNFGEWLTAEVIDLKALNSQTYPSGFHLFFDEEDAKWALRERSRYFDVGEQQRPHCRIVKVKYKHIHVRGTTYIHVTDPQVLDGHLPTIVVRQILVEAL